jgi:hypothetical protein
MGAGEMDIFAGYAFVDDGHGYLVAETPPLDEFFFVSADPIINQSHKYPP